MQPDGKKVIGIFIFVLLASAVFWTMLSGRYTVKDTNNTLKTTILKIGEADAIVSFEKLEAARYAPYLKKGGRIVVNTQEIDPMPVINGTTAYPSDVLERLAAAGITVDALDALTLAEEAGSPKAVNIVLMGHLARNFGIAPEKWLAAIEATVAPKFVELNRRAFQLGYEA